MRPFLRSDHGFAATLGLIMMPALILFTVILIDIGRGNNAHSDLQAAADAIALAGARELDGGTDSIDRAVAAMANISNEVSFLGQTEGTSRITLVLGGEGNAYTVTFLTAIPDSDDTQITADYLADHATETGTEAFFVHVIAQSDDLSTLGNLLGDVPVAAMAVATSASAACDVTPLFICNPFESQNLDLQEAFADGQLYSRMIRLHPKGSDTASPGNFGFLQVTGANDNTTASANAIRDIFAGAYNPTCYAARQVTSKPGAAQGIAQGLNVRMDIYEGNMNNAADEYPPDVNVRKGFVRSPTGPNNACNTSPTSDPDWAQSLPDDLVMSAPGDGAPGAFVGSGIWDIDAYWQVNYQIDAPEAVFDAANHPTGALPSGAVPSRYDVYNYEIANDLVGTLSQGNPAEPGDPDYMENGLPNCSISKNGSLPAEAGRRVIFAALVDCGAEADNGADEMRVNSYASLFLTRPMGTGVDGTIDVEIIDITGWGGNGTLDEFVRDEAILVR